MKVLLIAGLCAGVIGFGSGWTVNEWKRDAADKERIEQEAKKKDEQVETAQVASTGFEDKRTTNEVRYRTVTVTIEKVVDRPVYINQCIDDDGLRILNDQIQRRSDPGQPGIKMPGS